MNRNKSEPEKRFHNLLDDLGWVEIEENDGRKPSKSLSLHDTGKGIALIKYGKKDNKPFLYNDYRPNSGKSPKNYKKMVPDFVINSDFIEIKGNISGEDWFTLSRDSLNDNIRLALLRMKMGYVTNLVKSYNELSQEDREAADRDLSPHKYSDPRERYYIHLNALPAVIPTPNHNLVETTFFCCGMKLPIKVLAGMEYLNRNRLFIVDSKTMDQWEQDIFDERSGMEYMDRRIIREICQKNDISKMGLFGSTVRGESTESSDIDILVNLSKPKSLLSIIKIERILSEALGRKVDLVTESAISPYLKDRIIREVKVIYDAG